MDGQSLSVLVTCGIFFLIIFLLFVLFFIPSRQDSENDEHTDISDESTSKSDAVVSKTNTRRSSKEKSEPSQKTIYIFHAKEGKCLCPFCDGENNSKATVCNICRREL